MMRLAPKIEHIPFQRYITEIACKLAPRGGSRNVSTSSLKTRATLYEKINERVTHMLKYELGPLTIIKCVMETEKKRREKRLLEQIFS